MSLIDFDVQKMYGMMSFEMMSLIDFDGVGKQSIAWRMLSTENANCRGCHSVPHFGRLQLLVFLLCGMVVSCCIPIHAHFLPESPALAVKDLKVQSCSISLFICFERQVAQIPCSYHILHSRIRSRQVQVPPTFLPEAILSL